MKTLPVWSGPWRPYDFMYRRYSLKVRLRIRIKKFYYWIWLWSSIFCKAFFRCDTFRYVLLCSCVVWCSILLWNFALSKYSYYLIIVLKKINSLCQIKVISCTWPFLLHVIPCTMYSTIYRINTHKALRHSSTQSKSKSISVHVIYICTVLLLSYMCWRPPETSYSPLSPSPRTP